MIKSNKFVISALVILALIVIGVLIFGGKNDIGALVTPIDQNSRYGTSPKNTTYVIDGNDVTLTDGVSVVDILPGSAVKVTTTYFGNEVRHDLDDDGREDIAFILTQNTGGSGTFYYVVAALNKPNGYIGSEAFFLGDRIAPQTTEIDEGKTTRGSNRNNIIVVNFADRKLGESFAIQPSVGKSVWLFLYTKTMQFGEVTQNFEGESTR